MSASGPGPVVTPPWGHLHQQWQHWKLVPAAAAAVEVKENIISLHSPRQLRPNTFLILSLQLSPGTPVVKFDH